MTKKCISFFLILCLLFIGVFSYYFYSSDFHEKTPGGLTRTAQFDTLSSFKNIIPLAVLGSGPAGLSAALYGARAGVDTVVFAGPKLKGQLTETSDIENWPGVKKTAGMTVMSTLQEQAESFGARVILDSAVKVDSSHWPFKIKTADGETVYALSLIIATGANPRKLAVAGEEKYWGKGVSTCAVCDAPYYKDGDVIVVGGGDSAAEEAMQLAPYARSITLLVRGDKMRASAIMQERLKEYPHIKIRYNTEISKITGDDSHVSEVEIYNNVTKISSTITIDGVFLAIGHIPNTKLFAGQLAMNDMGVLELQPSTQQTSTKGIFAAGEVADERYRQAGVSAGDGIKAALDALSFLRGIGFSEQEAKHIAHQRYEKSVRTVKMPLEKITTIDELEKQVMNSKGIVVLDFYADYCGSCLQMMPAIEEIASEYAESIKFYKVDAARSDDIAQRLFVTSLPTILVFKNGTIDARYTKAMNKQELREIFSHY